jgi:hypothetical protein
MSYAPEATQNYAGLVRTSQSDAVALSASEKGANNGVATLDGAGGLAAAQAPAASVYETGGAKALDLANVAGSLQGGQLSAGAKSAALASKVVLGHVVSALQTKSGSGSSHAFDPGSGTYVGAGEASKGVLGAVTGAGAANEFDTGTNKPGASASPDATKLRVKVLNENNDELLEGDDEVWAIQSEGTVYFFAGAFDSTAAVVTVPNGVQFKLVYKQRYDLSDAPEEAFLSQYVDGGAVAPNSVDGSAIVDGSLGTDELADEAVTQAKLAPSAVGANQLADDAVDTAAVQDDAITQAKLAPNAVGATELADGSVDTAALQNDAVTPTKADLAQAWAFDGLLTTNAGQKVKRRSVSGTVAVQTTDMVLLFDTSSAAGTANLPAAASMVDQPVTVKNKAGGSNPVTVDGSGSEQVEGGDTLDVNPGSSTSFVSDGAAWHAL